MLWPLGFTATIRCLFHAGKGLRSRGLNRIGNLLVPNDNYCVFEDWINPVLVRGVV